jgi:hypothetical protein
MALGFCVATVIALVVGGTRHGEMASAGLQVALALAMLAVMWPLVGIMFTLARPGGPGRARDLTPPPPARSTPAELTHVNWFRDATAGSGTPPPTPSRNAEVAAPGASGAARAW